MRKIARAALAAMGIRTALYGDISNRWYQYRHL
jgi:hypothetical protein